MSEQVVDMDYQAPEVLPPGPSVKVESKEEPKTDPSMDPILLTETIKALENRINAEAQNARVIADPDVRALLEAKARGEKIKVVKDEVIPQDRKPKELPTEDLDKMTNSELTRYMIEQLKGHTEDYLSKQLNAHTKQIEEKLQPQIDGVLAAEAGREQARVIKDLEEARTKFRDFKQLEPKIAEINSKVQGISIEEMYFLAKMRSGLPLVTQEQIETEKPGVPKEREFKRPENTRGRSGFSNLVAAALTQRKSAYQE